MKYSELFSILYKDGWYKVRQSGSHIIMKHPIKMEQLTVPFHSNKEVKKGYLSALLKQAEIKTNKR
jgi:predicted RNA binding protein YcfA (HicA-like mRNA interferase family)